MLGRAFRRGRAAELCRALECDRVHICLHCRRKAGSMQHVTQRGRAQPTCLAGGPALLLLLLALLLRHVQCRVVCSTLTIMRLTRLGSRESSAS